MYAYAKTGDLGALEEFISGAQQANLQARSCTPALHVPARAPLLVSNNRLAFGTWFVRPHRVSQG